MFTGHWVHFSIRHLIYDLVPLGVAGWMMETQGRPRFGWFCAVAPWVISAVLLVFEPRMRFCGGLSGLATAVMVLAALGGWSDSGTGRWVGGAVLWIVAGKSIFEVVNGRTVFATLADLDVVVCVTSHVAGAATALVFYAAGRVRPREMAGRKVEIMFD
jgi:membrane associated rhomboid family serine protease